MNRRAFAAAGGVAAVAAAVALPLALRNRTRPESAAARSGAALAAALGAGLENAAEISAPHRCAKLTSATGAASSTPTSTALEARALRLQERTLEMRAKLPLVVGVVADARTNAPPVAEALADIRSQLEQSGVDLLLSLGGMGRTQAEIMAALRPLAAAAPWPVLAIPGDREALEAHRAAVAKLNREADALVLDGSEVRFVAAGKVLIASLPGAANPSRLVAGADGCQFTSADVDALAAELSTHDQIRVWATHTPPRQTGAAASDLALGGIHIGDRGLAAAIADSGASLVVHGLVDEAAARQRAGSKRLSSAHPIYLASGAVDPTPLSVPPYGVIAGAALVLRIGATKVTWRPILVNVAESRPREPAR